MKPPKKLNTWTKTKKMGEDYLVLWESVVEIKQKQDEIIDYLSDKEETSKLTNEALCKWKNHIINHGVDKDKEQYIYTCSCSYIYDPELKNCPACGEKTITEASKPRAEWHSFFSNSDKCGCCGKTLEEIEKSKEASKGECPKCNGVKDYGHTTNCEVWQKELAKKYPYHSNPPQQEECKHTKKYSVGHNDWKCDDCGEPQLKEESPKEDERLYKDGESGGFVEVTDKYLSKVKIKRASSIKYLGREWVSKIDLGLEEL